MSHHLNSLIDLTELGAAPPLPLLKQRLAAATEQLKQRFTAGDHASQLVHDRAQVIDQLLLYLWSSHVTIPNDAVALIAVGGYGRGELHPGSDVDLLILLHQALSEHHKEEISRFLTLLWDLKIDVGHSVRTLAECQDEAERDITVATNLMEARHLAGSLALFNSIIATTGPAALWPSRQFFEAKWQEQIARYRKFHDAVYNLEPHVKEGPGGLRDIQMIGWVAKRHFGATTLHDLVYHRFLTETEYCSLMEGQEFLWRVRLGLHLLTGRREDRLLFDYQKTLAQQFGYHDT
ncbi:MAG: protein-PII uridylyltransferase, partial [Halothiobacillaceae bacterium]